MGVLLFLETATITFFRNRIHILKVIYSSKRAFGRRGYDLTESFKTTFESYKKNKHDYIQL